MKLIPILLMFGILAVSVWAVGSNSEPYSPELVKKAESGDARGQLSLGNCYMYGRGVPQDAKEAVKWFRKSAEQLDAQAQNVLGACYFGGLGVPQDQKEGLKWQTRAAEGGDANSQFQLGKCYWEGTWDSTPQDPIEAAKWWTKSAVQGHAEAQFNLGYCYLTGRGVSKDQKEGLRLWMCSADQGNEKAKEAIKGLQKSLSK